MTIVCATWPELEAVHPEIAAQWDCLGPPEGTFRFRFLTCWGKTPDEQTTVIAENLACNGHPTERRHEHADPCLCYLYNRYDLAPRQWLSRHTLAPPVIPGPQVAVVTRCITHEEAKDAQLARLWHHTRP